MRTFFWMIGTFAFPFRHSALTWNEEKNFVPHGEQKPYSFIPAGYTMAFVTSVGHGPLTRYVKLRVAPAPEMPGTFSPPPRVSDPDMDHGMCVTHVSWCMPGSLTGGFLRNRWWGKRSQHSRCLRNRQFYVSGKSYTYIRIREWMCSCFHKNSGM